MPKQPYAAERTNVTYYPTVTAQRKRRGEIQWVVRGGDYKGFGKIPRFAGNKAECEAVATALNALPSENN